MTDAELIAWLREADDRGDGDLAMIHCATAADRIEALIEESARRLVLARDEGVARVEQFERAEAAEAKLAKVEALMGAGFAEYERRLAKAVETLEYCIKAPFSGWTIAQGYARATLAEIKGESRE